MEENKRPKRKQAPKRQKKVTHKAKVMNWEKYGILIALIGTLITSIFSLFQWQQTAAQLEQGQISIRQTQDGLNENRKQNKLAFDQLLLAQKQFRTCWEFEKNW